MSDLTPSADESLDRLTGAWHVFQLRRGHRFSTDDVAAAWRAAKARPDALRYLDIGCGIGSVGLTTLAQLHPEAHMTGVEVQQVSAELARRSVRYNGLQDRVRIVHGDLRDPKVLPADARFDLITGSPPYFPEGTALLSPVPQRAGARVELRGSVFDYCAAARRWLAPGGRFCFVMLAGDPRTEEAPPANGLAVVERWDYVFREGRAPHITTLVCALAEEYVAPRRTGRLVIRDAAGVPTPEYERFRSEVCPPGG